MSQPDFLYELFEDFMDDKLNRLVNINRSINNNRIEYNNNNDYFQ